MLPSRCWEGWGRRKTDLIDDSIESSDEGPALCSGGGSEGSSEGPSKRTKGDEVCQGRVEVGSEDVALLVTLGWR